MRVALIPPVELLRYTSLTDTQLMLPHLLRSSQYAEHYAILGQDPNQYVIMDNGAAESADTFDDEALLNCAIQFKVDEVVASDVLGESDFSAAKTIAFIDQAERMNYNGKIGIVAQGIDLWDSLYCINTILRKVDADVIYIPRRLITKSHPDVRIALAQMLFTRYPGYRIHLLGASSIWPTEIHEAAKLPYIRSMDTSMPFVYAMHGESMNSMYVPHRNAQDDYFHRIWSASEEKRAAQNVEQLMSWSRGK